VFFDVVNAHVTQSIKKSPECASGRQIDRANPRLSCLLRPVLASSVLLIREDRLKGHRCPSVGQGFTLIVRYCNAAL